MPIIIIILALLCCYLGFRLWIVSYNAERFAYYYLKACDKLSELDRISLHVELLENKD
jgi:hypothetical protein